MAEPVTKATSLLSHNVDAVLNQDAGKLWAQPDRGHEGQAMNACLRRMARNAGAFDRLPERPVGPANSTYAGFRDFFASSDRLFCGLESGKWEGAVQRQPLPAIRSSTAFGEFVSGVRALLLPARSRLVVLKDPSEAKAVADAANLVLRQRTASTSMDKSIADAAAQARQSLEKSLAERGIPIGPAERKRVELVGKQAGIAVREIIEEASKIPLF
jgi:hypothetical protein